MDHLNTLEDSIDSIYSDDAESTRLSTLPFQILSCDDA
jgi:hypothetical protein